jgi:tetratricopeptide (TPR) repeat protein
MTPHMTQAPLARAQAQALLQQGIEAGNHDPAQAFDLFQQCTVADPSWGIPFFLIGSHHAARGELEQAELAFSNAVLLSPEFPLARFQLGTLQFSAGRAAAALVSWQPLLNLPESDPIPHFVRGYAALAQDDFDNAVRHYEDGLARNTANEALSGDIRRIIARIGELKEPVPSAAPQQATDGAEENHVLLSNYQRHGHSN